MKIGVAKEIKPDEYRVALTPAGALELRNRGHDVAIEESAGVGSSFSDADYERVGARIVSVDEVWEGSELVLKVKEPIEPEYRRLREGLILFTYLHIAADEPLTRALIDSGIAAVAYETVEVGRSLPLLAPMSEVAGRLAPQAGAYFLEKPMGGRGLLLGGVPGVAPGKVVIVGGGVVGYNAAVIALGFGAQVTILERSIDRMRHLEEVLSGRVTLLMSSSLQVAASIEDADLVIGAVLIPGAVAPKLVTREMISSKPCTTATNASAGATVTGVSGQTFTSASFTLANAAQCQGGSPRFNVVAGGTTFFLGCNTVTPTINGDGTATYTFTAATIAAGGNQVPVPAGTISSVDVLIDVQGTADLSNITFNGQAENLVAGGPTSKAQCKKGGWKMFTDPSFKNQGQCVSWFNHHVAHHGKGKAH